MSLHGSQIIGPEKSRAAEPSFCGRNPATGETLPTRFAEATTEEIDSAMELARQAHLQGLGTRADRAAFLEAVADAIMATGDVLLERAGLETGLPAARLTGERARTVGQLRLFAGVVRDGGYLDVRVDSALPERQPLPRPELRRILQPIGPVVVFGASNFPLAFSVAGGDTASALAAGCPVVVKGHPSHPGTSELVAEAVAQAVSSSGMPPGTFSMLQGTSHELGRRLVAHPHTRAVGFTGSLRGGKALFDIAVGRPDPIPFYGELGSVNPVFVLPDAAAREGDALATALVGSCTQGTGQFCTNPGLVFGVRGRALTAFADQLGRGLAAVEPGVMLNEGILAAYDAAVQRLVRTQGVELAAQAPARAGRAAPTLFVTSSERFRAEPALAEEVFGPSTLLVLCETGDELLQVAGELDGQLSATIHAAPEDYGLARRLIPHLADRVGRILFGGVPTGVEVAWAQNHGGPFPASTDARSTSVGTAAIERFVRPVCYQGFPPELLPTELQDSTLRSIPRREDGTLVTPS